MADTSDTRARGWCYTANSYTPELETSLQKYKSEYHVYTHEIGESGTPHLQGYIEFTSPKKFSTLRKRFHGVHFEQRRGTKYDAMAYCIKTGPPTFESGERPTKPQPKNNYLSIREQVSSGATKRAIIESGATLRDLNYLDAIRDVFEPQRTNKPIVHWFYGDSGTGKTTCAHSECADTDVYCVPPNPKWWPGYDRHTHVIVDELRDQWSISMLLRLLDFLPLKVEIKGGHVTMVAEHIYITTLYSPSAFMRKYYPGEQAQQLLRRIDDLRFFSYAPGTGDYHVDVIDAAADGEELL